MTDKQHDTQKAAGRASGAHTQQTDTRNKPRGRGHSRRHTAATEHTAGSRERRKEKEYVIYLRERGEKNTAETRKSM